MKKAVCVALSLLVCLVCSVAHGEVSIFGGGGK